MSGGADDPGATRAATIRSRLVRIRTPYNKKGFRKDDSEARFFDGQGFVVAVQDTSYSRWFSSEP